jgi:hypothetical protein
MEDFYIGGASVKLLLSIFKMNFPEIVDIALPAEGVFHNLVFVSIKKTYPMQAYKIMHGLKSCLAEASVDFPYHTHHDAYMRTTLTLDPDIAAKAKKGAAKLRKPLKEVINAALRVGLDEILAPPAAKPYRTKARPLGLRQGFSYDNISELLARVEGEDHS